MDKICNIIKEARGSCSQKEFANELSKSQASISKYEKGLVNPPSYIVEKCMNIMNKKKTR